MNIEFLSWQECEDKNANNGDCVIIDDGKELVIYDCGCEDYAKYVINYMNRNGYDKVKIVLSHNDDDHFKGIPYLIEITTVLLLKYVDELLSKINNKSKNRDSIKIQIIKCYDNIKKLSGNVLKDAFTDTKITDNIEICGPGKEFILNAAAKGLDSTEGDTINGTTITNETSIHLKIKIGNKCMLLTGDSSLESVNKENLKDFQIIQLPHHGKKEIGEEIIKELSREI